MNVFSRVWVVFAKEAVDNIRDRRSIAMAAIYPVIGPMMLGLLLGFAQHMFRPDQPGQRTALDIAVVGAENAPGLIGFLEQRGVRILPPPADPLRDVRYGALDVALIIPEAYSGSFAAERPATVQLVINATRLSTVMSISRAIGLLRSYGREVGTWRLEARGIAPRIADAIRIDSVNVGKARSLAGFFLNMIPPFLIFTIFIGGVYLALDTTSGERERGSLEPLLTNPLARWEFMLGKVMAAFLFTVVAVIIQLFAFALMFSLVLDTQLGLDFSPGLGAFTLMLLLSMPVMLLAVALQVIVAAMTRSFKETQTYLGLLPLIPAVPGIILVFVSIRAELWMMSIPTFSQVVLIGQLVRGDPITLANAVASVGATLIVSAALLVIAGRLYSREELLFSA